MIFEKSLIKEKYIRAPGGLQVESSVRLITLLGTILGISYQSSINTTVIAC